MKKQKIRLIITTTITNITYFVVALNTYPECRTSLSCRPSHILATNGFVQFPAISILCMKRAAVQYIYVCQGISVDSAVTAPPQAHVGLTVQSPIAN